MYCTALRSASRPMLNGARAGCRAVPRRFASTSPADKPRSWKSSVARWGLVGGVVYYYTTSPIFADEVISKTIPAPASFADSDLPTVDSVIEEKRKQYLARLETPREEQKQREPKAELKAEPKATEPAGDAKSAAIAETDPGQLEGEAGQQGAFNPETGEINWDCPCLGGMADGPCGEDFKTAFSCFVYSNEEPKGMDCIDKFQGMQECFRKYPDIYGAELADEEAADAALEESGEPPMTDVLESREAKENLESTVVDTDLSGRHQLPGAKTLNDPIPAKWDDATAANNKVQEEKKEEKKD